MQTVFANVEAEFLYKQLHQFVVNSDFGHLIRVNKTETSLSPGAEQLWYLPPRPVTLPDGAITRGNPPPGAFQTSDWAFPYGVVWLIVKPLSPNCNKLEISGDNAPGFEDCLAGLMTEVRRFCPIEASQPQTTTPAGPPPKLKSSDILINKILEKIGDNDILAAIEIELEQAERNRDAVTFLKLQQYRDTLLKTQQASHAETGGTITILYNRATLPDGTILDNGGTIIYNTPPVVQSPFAPPASQPLAGGGNGARLAEKYPNIARLLPYARNGFLDEFLGLSEDGKLSWETMVILINEGKPQFEIAGKLSISQSAISKRLHSTDRKSLGLSMEQIRAYLSS